MVNIETQKVFTTAIGDVEADIKGKSDAQLLEIAFDVKEAYENEPNISLEDLLATYGIVEINVVDKNGIIYKSTEPDSIDYDMTDKVLDNTVFYMTFASDMRDILINLWMRLSTAEEYHSFRDALLVVMLYSTGMRLAEITALTTDSLAGNLSEVKVLGKGGKERIIPIVNKLRTPLADYLQSRQNFCTENICISRQKALFLTTKRNHEGEQEVQPMSRFQIERVVQKELAAAGVQGKHSPHVWRHTFATMLMDGGADLREIQELLGHASLNTTQIYTHTSIAQLREVYNKAHPRGGK
jgi:hypothetical protein